MTYSQRVTLAAFPPKYLLSDESNMATLRTNRTPSDPWIRVSQRPTTYRYLGLWAVPCKAWE